MNDSASCLNTARSLASGPLKELAPEWDRDGQFPTSALRLLSDAGITSLTIPTRYGGVGAELPLVCKVLEAIGEGCINTGIILTMHLMSLQYLGGWADEIEEQDEKDVLWSLQKRIFDDVVRNGALVANCYGEPGSGANVFQPFTQARRVDGLWVINGVKFGTLADHASHIQFHARIVGSGSNDDDNVIQFIVPTSLPGIRVEKLPMLVGVRAAAPRRVIFSDCRVEEAFRFGPIGYFWRANRRYPYATVLIAAPYLGLAQAALTVAVEHLKGRRQQGSASPVSSYVELQFLVGRLAVQLEAARSLLYRAAQEAVADPGVQTRVLNDAAKCAVADAAKTIAVEALQLCGTRMLMTSAPAERHLRNSLAAALHPPTSVEAFTTIGRLVLGGDTSTFQEQVRASYSSDHGLPDDDLPRSPDAR